KNVQVYGEPDVDNPQYYGETVKIEPWMAGDSSYRFESGIGLNWYQPVLSNDPATDCGYWGCSVPGWNYGGISDADVARPTERVIPGAPPPTRGGAPNDQVAAAGPGGATPIRWNNWIMPLNEDNFGKTAYGNGASRHNKQMDVGYYDGHVKSVRRTN